MGHFQAWKVMEFNCQYWKVMETQGYVCSRLVTAVVKADAVR